MKQQLLLVFAMLLTNFMYSQDSPLPKKAVLLKSVITTAGSAPSLGISNQKYIIQQSSGQHGITTKVDLSNGSVQQGFLTHTKRFRIKNDNTPNFDEKFPLVIYPNPFIDYIKITFTTKTQHPIKITIYDLNGKVFRNKTYPASKSITVPMRNYSIGGYLVQVVSRNRKYVKKVFKEQ